jgi:hypothetical protein
MQREKLFLEHLEQIQGLNKIIEEKETKLKYKHKEGEEMYDIIEKLER